ncbi:MAG: dipicolinate synthase [Clostridia bacterium]|nr:dipicolinate synthase [Clostridia bacterium]
MKFERLTVIGGDERQLYLARDLAKKGYTVSVWGLGEVSIPGVRKCRRWEDAVAAAHAVILPLPASVDGVRVHCPLHHEDESLRLSALFPAMEGKPLLGGRLEAPLTENAAKYGVTCIDYFQSEITQLRNALPTAEGAIAIAMKELPVTLDGSLVAVVGYGRIGALLAEKLTALGARVLVYARKKEALVCAELHHQIPMLLTGEGKASTLAKLPKDCRAVFNTVPVWLFDREVLEHLPRSCVLIDLASAPGGIDRGAANELGIRTVWGTALPGKCTPESAGSILALGVLSLLEEYTP